MKDWKTTLMGFGALAYPLLLPFIVPGAALDFKLIGFAVIVALIGYFSKDKTK